MKAGLNTAFHYDLDDNKMITDIQNLVHFRLILLLIIYVSICVSVCGYVPPSVDFYF